MNINCYNSRRCFDDISKKLQKGHNIWQFKDYNSARSHENQTNDPILFICFLIPNCLVNLFLHLKIVKIHFHEVPPLAHSGLQYTWILRQKCEIRVLSCWIQETNTLRKVEKGFTFSTELRINSKIFRVISWSISN